MTETKVWRDNRLHVLADRCQTCIFRPQNLMHLQPGRVQEMVQTSLRNEGVIPCHSTIYRSEVKPAICRGFYDAYGERIPLVQIAGRMNLVVEDTVPPKDSC